MSKGKRYTMWKGGTDQYVSAADYEALEKKLAESNAAFHKMMMTNGSMGERNLQMGARIRVLETALQEIVAFSPGEFRGLMDEVSIWRIASAALSPETPEVKP